MKKEKDPVKELIKYHEFRIKTCKEAVRIYKKDNFYDQVTEKAKEIQFHTISLSIIKNLFNLKTKL